MLPDDDYIQNCVNALGSHGTMDASHLCLIIATRALEYGLFDKVKPLYELLARNHVPCELHTLINHTWQQLTNPKVRRASFINTVMRALQHGLLVVGRG